MSQGSLPVDDFSPRQPFTQPDSLLHSQLEKALCRHFFEACEGTIQSLLVGCQWTVSLQCGELTLTLYCLSDGSYQRVFNSLKCLAQALKSFSPRAKIRIFSPQQDASPREFNVAEISLA
jgi:hypothetical protein